jgi:hypothetical protein
MRGKRGQVTLFIVLGALLVLALIVLIVFRNELTLSRILPDRILPAQTSAIQTFIESCAQQVGREGIDLLGAQGGYIWLPSYIENNPLAVIDTGIKVPHWQYQSENRIPAMQVMEAHLARYMNENLKICLDNLEAFDEEYTIVEKGTLSTQTTLTDTNVRFEVNYPLDLMDKDGKKVTEVTDFYVEVDVRLKHMHEVARAIMETEAQQMKFEKIAIDLLALDPDIPLSGTEISCSRKTWPFAEVQEKVKVLLRNNIPRIRVDHTHYEPVPDDQPYVLNHYVWRVTELNYDDLSVGLTVMEQPLKIDVRPRKGAILQASKLQGKDLASFVCMQHWNFVYDIQFPVLVSVEDTGSNAVLNFGFVASVDNNRPKRDQFIPVAPQTAAFDSTTDGDYCGNAYGNYNLVIDTYDNVSDPVFGESRSPIDGVNISLTCLKYTCLLGKTKYTSGGAAARLDAPVPYCTNAILRAKKTGYKPTQQIVTPAADTKVELSLTPIVQFRNFGVVKHVDIGGVLSAGRAPDSDEQAFITIRYKNNRTIIHETSGALPITLGDPPPLELLAEVDVPYDLEIYLMDGADIIGGYVGTWTPEWRELKDAHAIEFHVVAQDRFSSDEARYAFLATLSEQSKNVPEPVII